MTPLEKMKALAAIENKILMDKTGKQYYGIYCNTAGLKMPKEGGRIPKAQRKPKAATST